MVGEDKCDAEEGDGVADVVGSEVGVFDEGRGGYVADVRLRKESEHDS